MLWCIPPFWFGFSHKTWMMLVPSLCTHQTLHQHTSLSLQSWNPYWKDDNLSLFRRLKKIHWQSYTVLQKRHSRNASQTVRNAGSDKKWRQVLQRGKSPTATMWENDLYKLFGIFTDRPRTQKPNYLSNKPLFQCQSDQLATCITATTMMLSWNYSTWNTSAISCCVGTGPPDSAGVATGLVVSVSLLTEKQHHPEQLLDTIAESKKLK